MQIGNPELDLVYDRVMVPALRRCGLDARRVDRHNVGGLLYSEIIAFIEESDLILTAREDHSADSPNHRPGGPKVHFDLTGYDSEA